MFKENVIENKRKKDLEKKQRNDADKLTPGNFIQEPNGGGTYPDFHIVLNNFYKFYFITWFTKTWVFRGEIKKFNW